jgi:hypothetical protein
MLDATEMSVSTDADFKTAPRGAQPRARGFECDSPILWSGGTMLPSMRKGGGACIAIF